MGMASEEIEMENEALITREKINKDSSGGDKSDWVVELEEQIIKDVETSGRTSPVVFRVAKMFSATEQQFYIPNIISFGPYHFGPGLRSMEPHKTEAVRRMQKRLNGQLQKIVETEIVTMGKKISNFYGEELSYSDIDLAWMVTVDSCFLFEFFLNDLRLRNKKRHLCKNYMVKGMNDAILSSSIINPTWKCILYDLLLFENQIPLFVLEHLLAIAYSERIHENILRDILNAVARRATNQVFRWEMEEPYKKQKTLHYLDVLYYGTVGWNLDGYRQKAYSLKDRRLLQFRGTKSIFPRWMRGRGNCLRHSFQAFAHGILSLSHCMSDENHGDRSLKRPSVEELKKKDHGERSLKRPSVGEQRKKDHGDRSLKLPSVAELKKKGINLCAVTSKNSEIEKNDQRQGIRWVQFEEKTSTLYLPEVRIDHYRHALLRNFIALENTSRKYIPCPITAFAFFMNELVDSEEDIAVLREEYIIENFFGSNKEAAECFNSLTMNNNFAGRCQPINDARDGLHKYLRREYRILWNEFISTYFAKPWLVAGSVGATLLLLMTLVQVFCLFYTCNRSQ